MRKILLLMFLAFSLPAMAADYYVRTDGNNENDGSANDSAHAWLTIGKCASTMVAGDTCNVAPGTYDEDVDTVNAGSSGNWITYQASASGVISHSFEVRDSYTKIIGFELHDSISAYAYIYVASDVNYYEITNNSINQSGDSEYRGIWARGTNGLISGNTIYNLNYLAMTISGHDTIIEDNVIDHNRHDNVWFYGHNITFRHNEIKNGQPNVSHSDVFQTAGVNGPAYDIIIEKNYIHDNNTQICQISAQSEVDSRDWTFRNNVIARTLLACNVNAPGFEFYNNLFWECTTNTGHVIYPGTNPDRGIAYNTIIENNFFIGCGSQPYKYGTYYIPSLLVEDLIGDYNYFAQSEDNGFIARDSDTNPQEVHGINGGDPLFANTSTDNFQVSINSPAAGAGLNLYTSFTTDYLDNERPSESSWTIGPLIPMSGIVCDMNGDTHYDADDILFLVDIIQGRETSSNGDLNNDGEKNILDLMLLLKFVRNGDCVE
jgi:hypothetical protein